MPAFAGRMSEKLVRKNTFRENLENPTVFVSLFCESDVSTEGFLAEECDLEKIKSSSPPTLG
uniref:Uncharacterized protein n=1 Tax=Timema monikensis TaxID=170555 RepID=A0A7R9HTP7_9NEOP|nr:unnamed protein product [Timema monikensis]